MSLLGMPLPALLLLVVRHHLPHHSGVDYVGVFLASGASWVGLPGPGEAALIAAGISAAHGRLDLSGVLAAAWVGAVAGGSAGWIGGLKGGRGLLTAPGPLLHLRLSLIAKGDLFYERYGTLAVLFTPSWMAGIHGMRPSRFLPVNTISALVWALAIGLGAYLIGPSITDIVADAGTAGTLAVVALFILTAVVLARRRHRYSGRRSDGQGDR